MGQLRFKLRPDSRSVCRENKDTKDVKTVKNNKKDGVWRGQRSAGRRDNPQTGSRPWSPAGHAWSGAGLVGKSTKGPCLHGRLWDLKVAEWV